MDPFGVELSIISNLNGIFYKNTQKANEELYNEINSRNAFRDRFIPFAVINPIYNGWEDDFKTCRDQYKMKGIRLYPKYHGYNLDNPACIELVKMARDNGLPVSLCLRMVDSRTSSWNDIEEEWALSDVMPLIREVPDAKYMIVNVANNTSLDEEETALLKQADVVMDTSGRGLNNIVGLLETYGEEKFVFGTHSPILDYCTGLLRIQSLRPDEADQKAKEKMLSGNIRRYLNL
ncbi:amidohydrolase family protein [Fodinibius sediminis]|nr:amidohydrolase family protein [Fodinibius sediminis]